MQMCKMHAFWRQRGGCIVTSSQEPQVRLGMPRTAEAIENENVAPDYLTNSQSY